MLLLWQNENIIQLEMERFDTLTLDLLGIWIRLASVCLLKFSWQVEAVQGLFIKDADKTLKKVFTNWCESLNGSTWCCCCRTTGGGKKLLLFRECCCALKNRWSKLAICKKKNPFSPERRLWHSWSFNLDVKSCERRVILPGPHTADSSSSPSWETFSLVSSSGPDFRTRLVVIILSPRIKSSWSSCLFYFCD